MDGRLRNLENRLAILGASPGRIEAFRGLWQDSSPEERVGLRVLGDLELMARANLLDPVQQETRSASGIMALEPPGPLDVEWSGTALPPIEGVWNIPDEPDENLIELAGEIDRIADSGTIADVLAWVGDDRARAELALDAEQRFEKPRVSLVRDLRKLCRE